MARGDRLTVEVYYDIMRSIQILQKAGKRTTLYNVGRRAYVPNNRLRARLGELAELGLVDSHRIVTLKGYEYCEAYSRQIAPFLRKYRLGGGDSWSFP